MKQFGTIFRFELLGYLKNKIFIGVTVFLVLVLACFTFYPRVSAAFENGEGSEGAVGKKGVLLLLDADEDGAGGVAATLLDAFEQAFPDYVVLLSEESADRVSSADRASAEITAGKATGAFVFRSLTDYTYYVKNLSMYDVNTTVADEVLLQVYRMNAVISQGISPEDAGAIFSRQITHETENLGKDQMQNFFYTYVMIFALYMVILIYGQMVAMNVAAEKSSRAMELLVTSASPTGMMFGKVFASCLAGFLQLVVIFGSSILFFRLNSTYIDENGIIASIFNMPLDLFAYMLLFFVLGFLVYSFLFGAVGSTVSKTEDLNTSCMPLTFLFVAGFMVVIFSMSSGNLDSTLMRVCSYLPFTSPMAMFTRIAMSTVPFYEIAISVAILILSVIGIGIFSAKIYRVCVLLYGTPLKSSAILRAIRKA